MSVTRRQGTWPVQPLGPEGRIDRIFRDLLRDLYANDLGFDRFFGTAEYPLNIEEFAEDDTYVIRAEMPGIDPDKDVELTVSEDLLHLSARREERTEAERPGGYHSEFHYGTFERTVRLPKGTTDADVTASYKDGILEIRIPMPKVEAASPTKVRIEH